jgi:hypothetical protein
MRHSVPPPQLVLCIPGPWADRQAFVAQLIERTGGEYLFAGRLLMHVAARHVFEMDFEPRDERMSAAFNAAGAHWRATPEMRQIATHSSVIYLVRQGGTSEEIAAFMRAAEALLDAGGLGVKVESSGLAHAPDAWREICAGLALFSAYRAFVVVVTNPGETCSCGMHTFGMRDVRVVEDDAAVATAVARAFSWYLFTERPEVHDGQTFACDAQAPVFRIASGDGVDYGPDSLFTNPYGAWHLQRL